MNKNKLVLAVVLLVLIGAFFVFDLGRFFSLAYLKSSQAEFAALYANHPAAVIGVFFAIYVAVTALSIPGAAVMTLAAGAIFGLRRRHGHRVVRLQHRRNAGVRGRAFRAARQRAVALRRTPGRDRPRRRQGGRVLPVHAAAGAAGAVLRDQPADGVDQR